MILYLLEGTEGAPNDSKIGDYDTCIGLVIRARNEIQARQMAFKFTGFQEYLNDKYTDCNKIETAGITKVILSSWNNS
jgi:hypothetical protein